jgi:hypothetical protein
MKYSEIPPFGTKWIEQDIIMLNEMKPDPERQKNQKLSLIC